jgi:stage II sporulation protein P
MSRLPRISLSWRGLLAVLFFYALFLGGFAVGNILGRAPVTVAAMLSSEPQAADSLLVLAKQNKSDDLTPRAVIYCTHTSEEYSGQTRQNGVPGGVLTAAKALADELEKCGIGVILLDDVFDAPDWNLAYANSLAALEKVKKQYPKIELFIDVHRDSQVPGLNTTFTDDSGSYARMMLIIGSNVNLAHPSWKKNKAFAEKVNVEIENIKPGLMRDPRVYTGRYNQHIGTKAFLVEIGSTANTVEQAKNSAKVLADAITAAL